MLNSENLFSNILCMTWIYCIIVDITENWQTSEHIHPALSLSSTLVSISCHKSISISLTWWIFSLQDKRYNAKPIYEDSSKMSPHSKIIELNSEHDPVHYVKHDADYVKHVTRNIFYFVCWVMPVYDVTAPK